MLKISYVPIKTLVFKDQNKESTVKKGTNSTDDFYELPMASTSTEEHLLSLSNRFVALETGVEALLSEPNASDVSNEEDRDTEEINAPFGNRANIGNNPGQTALVIETSSISPSLESKISALNKVQVLTEDEIVQTLALVEELQRSTPLVIEKREQVRFTPVVNLLQTDTDTHMLSVVIGGSVTTDEHQQLSTNIEADEIEPFTDESEFVVPELIAKVISTATTSWSAVGLKLKENTVMLLKSGLAYTSLNGPPGDLALPRDINEPGSKWTTWRQDESGAIYLATPGSDGESLLSGEEIDLTPLTNEDIEGLHTKANAATYGATMITSWADMRFNHDGTFEKARSVLTTTGGSGTMLIDQFTSSFHQYTADGSSGVVGTKSDMGGSGDAQVVNANSDSQRPNKNLYGTYHILEDGLTIEMRYANGRVDRELLYRGENYVFVGGSSYLTQSISGHYYDDLLNLALSLEKGKRGVWLSMLADAVMVAGRKSGSQVASSTHGAGGTDGTAKGQGNT